MSPDDPYEFVDHDVSFQPIPEERAYQIMDMANLVRFERALKEIVAVLGPELGLGCEDCQDGCAGLLAEANEALSIAQTALDGKHVMPKEEK